jgi:hypothetical protein
MNAARLDQIVQALLYEGYILYPYRPSSKKNCRERFTFGRVYPRAYSVAQNGAEPCAMQTECLVKSRGESATLEVCVRFLQPMWREIGLLAAPLVELSAGMVPEVRLVPELTVKGELYRAWQEAVERTVAVPTVALKPGRQFLTQHRFNFSAGRTYEPLQDEADRVVAVLVRRQEALTGKLEIEAQPWDAETFKLTVRILNETPVPIQKLDDSEAVLMRTFASTHTIINVENGAFISMTDPPAEFKEAAESCKNAGVWPVLAGDEATAERDTMLSSPIILPDYPKIAPESRGDFFDGTEIDEMLALRVLTMTDEEKREMRNADPFARRILERTEMQEPERLLNMYGVMRDVRVTEAFFNPPQRVERVMVEGTEVKAGDRVRIQPQGRADAMDMLLAGKIGIVEAIEQDAEGKVHLALVVEDDPGRDLGMLRQPGHRFFYGLNEVKPLKEEAA